MIGTLYINLFVACVILYREPSNFKERVWEANLNLFVLQVSRSIGDVYLKNPECYSDPIFQQFGNPIPLKRPVMTAEPSVIVRELEPQDLFLIFASDGLWEQLSDEAAVEIVYKYPRAVSSFSYIWDACMLKDHRLYYMFLNRFWLMALDLAGNCQKIGESCTSGSSKEERDEIWWHEENWQGSKKTFPWWHNCYCNVSWSPKGLL